MTNDGPVDNYLSAEEQKYFTSGGKNEEQIKYDDSGEPDAPAATADSEGLSDDDTRSAFESTNLESDEEADVASTESQESEIDDDAETSSETKRDYEKAFKTERHKRRELKEALEAQARKTSEMEATLERLKQSMLTPKEAPTAPAPKEIVPDPSDDPIGYQQYEINKLKETIKAHNQYLHNQHESAQKTAQQQAFLNTYKQSAQEFAKTNPDFMDAYNYVIDARTREHMAAGYSAAEAQSLVLEDEMAIASRAYQDRVNPAERVYNLAKARGYAGKKVEAKANPKSLDDLKRGIANSKSLKSGGGEVSEKIPGFDDIDNMKFDEFDKFWAGYKAKSKGQR